jgi:hypothetical protein
MVLELANSAVSDGFVIVHAMVDGLDNAQVREDGLEIVISHLPEKPPWHDGPNLPRAYLARPHDLQEHGFVVVADAGRIWCQIRAGHLVIRFCNRISARKLQPGKWFTIRISKRVTPLTGTKLDQICTSLYRRGYIRLRNWGINRNGERSDDVVRSPRRRKCISDGGMERRYTMIEARSSSDIER